MIQNNPFADLTGPPREEAEGYLTRDWSSRGRVRLHPDDPAYVCSSEQLTSLGVDDATPDLSALLKSQARLAMTMQRRVDACPDMDIKEMKDVATACSTLINGVHRTGELLRAMETYKLFHSVVISFIRARSDSTGEDLLEELKKAADEMNVRAQVGKLL